MKIRKRYIIVVGALIIGAGVLFFFSPRAHNVVKPPDKTLEATDDASPGHTPDREDRRSGPESYNVLFDAISKAFLCDNAKTILPNLPDEFLEMQTREKRLQVFLDKIRADDTVIGDNHVKFINDFEITVVERNVTLISPRLTLPQPGADSPVTDTQNVRWLYYVRGAGTCLSEYDRSTKLERYYITGQHACECYVTCPHNGDWLKVYLIVGEEPVAATEFKKQKRKNPGLPSSKGPMDDLSLILQEMSRISLPSEGIAK